MNLRALALLVLFAPCLGCGKGDAPQKPGPPAPAPAPAPADTQEPGVSPLDILASVNGSVDCRVSTDFPLVVEVDVFLKRGAGESLTLANSSGPWSDAVTLECTGAGNTERSSFFSLACTTNKSIDLTRERSGKLVWILDGAGSFVLPEGTWTIRAVVDGKKLGNTLPARLDSSPVTVVVTPPATAPTPGAAQRKCLAAMNAAAWKKDFAKALAAGDAHLAKNPEDVAVLFMKGQILRSQGHLEEALAALEASLVAANRNKKPLAENFAIERAVSELQRELYGK